MTTNHSKLSSICYFIKEIARKNPQLKPQAPLTNTPIDFRALDRRKDQVVWFGHSTCLLVLSGKLILIDPMFGRFAAPIPGIYQRFPLEHDWDLKELTEIDLVLFSHNHYDHLDKGSVLELDDHVERYLVPEGMSRDLLKWGIAAQKIQEVQWHERVTYDELQVTATPASHYSGRGLFDRDKSRCQSWVLKNEKTAVFFSGDSSYGPHFKEIGEQYGPFDYGLIECGQYDSHWPTAHMFPEESMQAAQEAQVNQIIPIHWAGFALGFHPWDEPIERALIKAESLGETLITPRIGQVIYLGEETQTTAWWR